ncbi:membrane-associating domain-containing protein [Exophiala viscosa]|uniref:Membrane-associating domain-containing protein n=1 Tax=Exophiala viscosa TaxID=2486360 RepID=A0AAN6E083_9EURO|nr:membrane-associating domain-containing protein [Exophiala viscosa]
MHSNPILILRGLQGILAFVAMALGATASVPSAVIFFVFTAVFTLLVTVPYTILTPRYFPVLAYPPAMLAAEAITSVLWLAGFAAVAELLRRSNICEIGACASARGSVVVGVFEWILFAGTTYFAFSHVFLDGKFAGGKNTDNKQSEGQRSWSGAEPTQTDHEGRGMVKSRKSWRENSRAQPCGVRP